ncbi:spore germination protein [Bacillus sp. sid0103]|uniref:spore germination protein n=1 Tax=Bacillus sp. sid0103 TaxID=2856337 RepID=UPI001C43AF6E|nr:spore germination protein [Bacillus sp. sid0103]MBV7504045.1 spore germination protein [Bacillus sp. sid0103]
MPYFINIFNIKTNGITQNGNLDIGATIHNSHTANSKFIGANFSLGDLSPTSSIMGNCQLDPDISDQDQIFNPSFPMSNQF